jgi:hypothetical protein
MGVIIRPIKKDKVTLMETYRIQPIKARNQPIRSQPIKKDTTNETGGITEFKARHPY